MSKVLVERSRKGGSRDRKGRDPRNLEDFPKKQSMKKAHTDRKYLNENLAPLKKFLNSKVGQNWNSVWSEICEHLKLTSAVQKHVRDHVFDFVHKDVVIDDKGVVKYKSAYYGGYAEIRHQALYVDPKTNCLKKYKRKETKVKQDPFHHIFQSLSNKEEYQFVLIDKNPYRLYKDKLLKTFSVKQEASKKHAQSDFSSLRWSDIGRNYVTSYSNHMIEALLKSDRINKKHPYFVKLFELYELEKEKFLKDKKKAKEYPAFKVGEEVEITTDNGKTWTKGVINRIERLHEPSYWITIGTKNKWFSRALGQIRSVAPAI